MMRLTLEQINEKKPHDSRLLAFDFLESKIKKNGDKIRMVCCKCNCGNQCSASVESVVSGITKSCGCLFMERLLSMNTKYHPSVPTLHRQYKHMMQRCYNKNTKSYKYYGGRGISVCDEWKGNYQAFLDWALNNGWEEGLHIDKDKKANGSLQYSPDTVSFLTAHENNQYRRKRGTALL